jgi:hypothetical protein
VGRERTSFRVMLLCCVTNFVRTLPLSVGPAVLRYSEAHRNNCWAMVATPCQCRMDKGKHNPSPGDSSPLPCCQANEVSHEASAI